MESLDKKAKEVKACETCRKPFGITRIRHTCKRCNKIICSDCTKGRIKIVTYDLKSAHKACIACEKESIYQSNFKTSNQASWNTLSKVGQKWLSTCNPKIILSTAENETEETYQGYLATVNNPNAQNPFFALIDGDIAQGKADREITTYSLQEFFYYNQAKYQTVQVRTSVSNVLKAFAVKFPSIGYSQGMNFLCMFLLSLMDEESAFWTLGYIVTQLLPSNFFGQTENGSQLIGYQQEKFVLANLMKDNLGLTPDVSSKIITILDVNGSALINTLLINSTCFEVSFEAWNKMLLNQSVNEIRKVIIQIFKTFLPIFIQKKSVMNIVEFKLMIIRLFNTDEFKESQSIQISDEAVKFFESKFKTEYSNQALVGNSKIYQTLNQMNYFQRDQIRSLRDQFNELARARPRRVTMRPDQSTLEVPEFVNKNDFKKLLAQIMTESKGFPQNVDFEQIYESFDIDQKGSVDFEEFLLMASMVGQGDFEEKIQTSFYIFDEGNKGHLANNEFSRFVQTLIQATIKVNQHNISPSFNEDLEKFSGKMLALSNNQEKIDFDTIRKDLFNNSFLKYCESIEKAGGNSEGNRKVNEGNTDTSTLQTNQTAMDSTQDLSNLQSNRDLTKILDHSTEQSALHEYEEEALTEEQKEKILDLKHLETEEARSQQDQEESPQTKAKPPVDESPQSKVKQIINQANQIDKEANQGRARFSSRPVQFANQEKSKIAPKEDTDEGRERLASNVEYVNTESAKSLIARFNKKPTKEEPVLTRKTTFNPKSQDSQLEEQGTETETQLPKIKPSGDSDSDSEQEMMKFMMKLKSNSPTKMNKTPTNMAEALGEGSNLSPTKVEITKDFSEALENFVSPFENIDTFNHNLHRPDFSLDFEKNEKQLKHHTMARLNKVTPSPFASNTASSLSQNQIDSEPSEISIPVLSFFEKTSDSISSQGTVKKNGPVKRPVNSESYQALSPNHPLAFIPIEGWKEGCFSSQEILTSIFPPVKISNKVSNPFNDSFLAPISTQEKIEKPPLGFCNIEKKEQDSPLNSLPIAKLSRPLSKPLNNSGFCHVLYPQPILEVPNLLSWGMQEINQNDESLTMLNPVVTHSSIKKPVSSEEGYQSLPLQHSIQIPKLDLWNFEKNSEENKLINSIQTIPKSFPLQKPFNETGFCQALYPVPLLEVPSLQIWNSNDKETTNQPTQASETISFSKSISKPFNEAGSYEPLPPIETHQNPTLTSWEIHLNEKDQQIPLTQNIVSHLKRTHKPINEAGLCQELFPQDRLQVPLLQFHIKTGLKEDTLLKAIPSLNPSTIIRKPFSAEGSLTSLLHQTEVDKPVLEINERNIFSSLNMPETQITSPKISKLLKKPFEDKSNLLPIPPQNSSSEKVSWKHKLFEPSNPQISSLRASSIMKTIAVPIQKGGAHPIIQNVEDHHNVKANFELFGSVNKPALTQDLAKLSKNIEQITKPLFDNVAQPLQAEVGNLKLSPLSNALQNNTDLGAEVQANVTINKAIDKVPKPFHDNPVPALIQETNKEIPTLNSLQEISHLLNKSCKAQIAEKPVLSHQPIAKLNKAEKVLQNEITALSRKNDKIQGERILEDNKADEPERGGSTIILDQSGSEKSYRSATEWHERERDMTVSDTDVIEESILRSGHHEMGKILAEQQAQRAEQIEKTYIQTNTEGVSQKQVIYDEDDDEAGDLNSTFVNMSAIDQKGIYTQIDETSSDNRLADKRKADAAKDALKGQKGEACKMCNIF